MKLLIISSELLHPENTLGSTFELSQAQILSSVTDVTIISVSTQLSFLAEIKKVFSVFQKSVSPQQSSQATNEAFRIGAHLLTGRRSCRHYQIEGVNVIEGVDVSFVSKGDFQKKLSQWVKAGMSAYKRYVQINGIPDIIHAHGRFLNAGELARHIHDIYGIKYIYTEHSTFFQRGIAPVESKDILLNIIRKASAYTLVSQSLLESVQNFLSVNFKQALIIPNALDKIFEGEIPLKERDPKGIYKLTSIGSLDEKKGIEILIRAFHKAFPDGSSRLYICGDGPLLDNLIALRDSLGLEQYIFFTGRKSKMEVREILDSTDFFVLPSIVETFGVVVIEAMARGCPVVATRSGGPEYIVDDRTALLTQPGDEKELADALVKMRMNLHLYDRNYIRDHTLQRYGSSAFLKKMLDLYKSVPK